MRHYQLHTRALLTLDGEEVLSFLQALISNDVRKLEKGEAIYATLLTPQGKFLHDLFLVKMGDNILVDCERARAEDLRKRLNLYKLRSKVSIVAAPENMAVFAIWGEGDIGAIRNATVFSDPRLPALGFRAIGDGAIIREWCKERNITQASEESHQQHRLSLGVPDGSNDLIPEKSLLLDWGIDVLNGVDFKKGCYVGQEVTARMHYRSDLKKSIYQVKSETGILPPAGEKIYCGETEAGELRSSMNGTGLALLRIEEVEKSKESGMPLRVGDVVITASIPEWFVKTLSNESEMQ